MQQSPLCWTTITRSTWATLVTNPEAPPGSEGSGTSPNWDTVHITHPSNAEWAALTSNGILDLFQFWNCPSRNPHTIQDRLSKYTPERTLRSADQNLPMVSGPREIWLFSARTTMFSTLVELCQITSVGFVATPEGLKQDCSTRHLVEDNNSFKLGTPIPLAFRQYLDFRCHFS